MRWTSLATSLKSGQTVMGARWAYFLAGGWGWSGSEAGGFPSAAGRGAHCGPGEPAPTGGPGESGNVAGAGALGGGCESVLVAAGSTAAGGEEGDGEAGAEGGSASRAASCAGGELARALSGSRSDW